MDVDLPTNMCEQGVLRLPLIVGMEGLRLEAFNNEVNQGKTRQVEVPKDQLDVDAAIMLNNYHYQHSFIRVIISKWLLQP